jgi:hypothetical protein
MGNDRPDFMSRIWSENGDKASWTLEEITESAQLILLAGGLPSVTYLLLTNPRVYENLTKQVRAVEKEEDITFRHLASMGYLGACVGEALQNTTTRSGRAPSGCTPKAVKTWMDVSFLSAT